MQSKDKDAWLVGQTGMTEDFGEIDWDVMTRELTDEMKKKNPGMEWEANVENFGWRGVGGFKPKFRAENGEDLLLKVLPKTGCSFHIFKYKDGFKIENAHHDKPVGGEWYKILPACKAGEVRDWDTEKCKKE